MNTEMNSRTDAAARDIDADEPRRAGEVHGWVDERFESVKTLFARMLQRDPTYSAQVCAYVNGDKIVDLWGGGLMDGPTGTGVFLAKKGAFATNLARLVDSGDLDLEQRVAYYWPEFAACGKDQITVSQMLSHQAGLLGEESMRLMDVPYDPRGMAAKLAAMSPLWRPGTAFGYHGRTIGPLMEELFRRVAGEDLQTHYEREVRAPRDIDFYIGFPESEDDRYEPILPSLPFEKALAERDKRGERVPGTAALSDDPGAGPVSADELAAAVGQCELGDSLGALSALGGGVIEPDNTPTPNHRHIRAAGVASTGGVGSARGLARLYAAAVTGLNDCSVSRIDEGNPRHDLSEPFLTPDTVKLMGTQQVFGMDRVLQNVMCFARVFQKPNGMFPFGSYQAIGHDGAGGALGFADPFYGLAFGYNVRRMNEPGGLDPKSVLLSACIRDILGGGR